MKQWKITRSIAGPDYKSLYLNKYKVASVFLTVERKPHRKYRANFILPDMQGNNYFPDEESAMKWAEEQLDHWIKDSGLVYANQN